jgi:uncharacterized protein
LTLSLEEGRRAVSTAREALDFQILGGQRKPEVPEKGVFGEPRGVFVTLNKAGPGPDRLRGCIGFPYPVRPLGEAVAEAAVAAATEDPRFPPVAPRELDSVLVEVSVLTVPRALDSANPDERPSHVRLGLDGLIVGFRGASGLLLPQVATEFGLDEVQFLSQACMKAGLPGDAWLEDETEVQVFQAEIFSESRPRGEVVRTGPTSSSG